MKPTSNVSKKTFARAQYLMIFAVATICLIWQTDAFSGSYCKNPKTKKYVNIPNPTCPKGWPGCQAVLQPDGKTKLINCKK